MKSKENMLIYPMWFWLPMMIGIVLFSSIILTNTNRELFFIINNFADWPSPLIWSNITVLGDTLIALVLFLPWIRKKNDLLWSIFFAAIVSIIISHGLKHLLAMPRPPALLGKDVITIIGPAYNRYSFPSGHATTIFTIVSLLIFTNSKITFRLFLFFSASVIATSRVVVGVHWPIDIIGGMLTGWFSSYIGLTLYSKFKQKLPEVNFSVISGIILISAIILLGFFKLRYPSTALLKNIVGILAIINIATAYMRRYEERFPAGIKNKKLGAELSSIFYRVDKIMTL